MKLMGRATITALVAGLLAVPLAGQAAAAKGDKFFSCAPRGAVGNSGVDRIRASKISCVDARTTIRAVEQHAQFCRPQKGTQQFRLCDVTVVLSTGTRTFRCGAYFVDTAHYLEHCVSGKTKVYYRRNFNAIG